MKQNVKTALIALVFLAIAGIAVVIMMLGDSKPSTFEIEDNMLVIGSSFGVSVPLLEISNIELTESIPKTTYKTNGLGLGSIKKGEFKMEGIEKAQLYIDESVPAFIRFIHADTVFYINMATPEETRQLYQTLMAAANAQD